MRGLGLRRGRRRQLQTPGAAYQWRCRRLLARRCAFDQRGARLQTQPAGVGTSSQPRGQERRHPHYSMGGPRGRPGTGPGGSSEPPDPLDLSRPASQAHPSSSSDSLASQTSSIEEFEYSVAMLLWRKTCAPCAAARQPLRPAGIRRGYHGAASPSRFTL
jgi:hypothetical protein